MSGTQITLAVIGVLAAIGGTNFLTSVLTRRSIIRQMEASTDKTHAEAQHESAIASKTEAETAQTLMGELRQVWGEMKIIHTNYLGCREEVSQANIKVGEVTAENERLNETIKMVRKENVEKDERIGQLTGILNDAGIKY